MIIDLPVAFVDTAARDLAFALDLPPQPAEFVQDRVVLGRSLQLRVLGASHQVILGEHAELIETVACIPAATAIPAERTTVHAGIVHRFTSRVEYRDDFERAVESLLADTGALIGRYPGDRYATTGIEVLDGPQPSWRTWHSYPQSREIVWTRTRIEAAPCR